MNNTDKGVMPSALKRFAFSLLTALFAAVCTIAFYRLFHYAPFGSNSLASADANIQYLDFYAYLKDCMTGDNSLWYSFSSSLGQSNIALFAYYLASPVNLLLLFIEKTQIESFFDIAVAIKLGLAAGTASWFLQTRFRGRLARHYTFMLSLAYAWMNYSFLQASNLMWLDGVYILPLILLGVWYCLEEGRIFLLSLSVGISILFNWYTAGISCLFAIMWFVFEAALLLDEGIIRFRQAAARLFLYIWSMGIGVLIGSVLFLPTVLLFFGGSGAVGSGDQQLFLSQFYANLFTAVEGYTLGAASDQGRISLYCGSMAIIGAVCFFISRRTTVRRRLIAGLMSLSFFLCCYYRPLSSVFSLFKRADSYWYRYAYTGTFLLIFLAAVFFARSGQTEEDEEDTGVLVLKAGWGFGFFLMLCNFIENKQNYKMLYFTMLLAIACSMFLYLYFKNRERKAVSFIAMALCLLLTVAELSFDAKVVMFNMQSTMAGDYPGYVEAQTAQIRDVKAYDDGLYRISQTRCRSINNYNTMSEYNESMAYNYWSAASYSSTRDLMNLEFMDRIGYRNEENCMSIVNTSVLPSDALLGIRYVLSADPIPGLQEISGLERRNGKSVYENPYALPMAFVYDGAGVNPEYEGNSFEYINALYSGLAGHEVRLFSPVEAEMKREDDYTISWEVHDIPEGQYLYGCLPWKSSVSGLLHVNYVYQTEYAGWLSPSLFSIPYEEGNTARVWLEAVYDAKDELVRSVRDVSLEDAVTFLTEEEMAAGERSNTGIYVKTARIMDEMEGHFYALDPEALRAVTEELRAREADKYSIENGHVSCVTEGKEGQSLYLAVPRNEGWVITRNGQVIEAETVGDWLISIPLTDGTNEISMRYTMPVFRMGCLLSLAGLVLLLFSSVILHIIHRKKADKDAE